MMHVLVVLKISTFTLYEQIYSSVYNRPGGHIRIRTMRAKVKEQNDVVAYVTR